jgi:hypothetical protein
MWKLSIDHEFAGRTWWESGGRALWDAVSDGLGSVVLEEDVARSWLAQASGLPGWDEGREYAPHPIAATPLREDDPDL